MALTSTPGTGVPSGHSTRPPRVSSPRRRTLERRARRVRTEVDPGQEDRAALREPDAQVVGAPRGVLQQDAVGGPGVLDVEPHPALVAGVVRERLDQHPIDGLPEDVRHPQGHAAVGNVAAVGFVPPHPLRAPGSGEPVELGLGRGSRGSTGPASIRGRPMTSSKARHSLPDQDGAMTVPLPYLRRMPSGSCSRAGRSARNASEATSSSSAPWASPFQTPVTAGRPSFPAKGSGARCVLSEEQPDDRQQGALLPPAEQEAELGVLRPDVQVPAGPEVGAHDVSTRPHARARGVRRGRCAAG